MKSSELILNKDGSLYHLGLQPGEVAETIITVGDQDRVEAISRHFTRVDIRRQNREFVTHTGYIENKRLTVISTGIGTDNIDIVMNELHSLFNLDYKTGIKKQSHKSLTFIRLGTSGTIREDINVDTILASHGALGFDSLLKFYEYDEGETWVDDLLNTKIELRKLPKPYYSAADTALLNHFVSVYSKKGITVTAPGFYAPQGRSVNAPIRLPGFLELLGESNIAGIPVTNIEMETAGIYGLATVLGHRALSISAILANRITGEFSSQPAKTVDHMIALALEKISELH